MKASLSVALVASLTAAVFSISAPAQGSPSWSGGVTYPGVHQMNCAKAKDKARCEALNKDIEACKDKIGDDWRECMHRPLPTAKFTLPRARDCSFARNKERCEAHTQALEACKDKTTRAEHRRCMSEQLSAQETKKG